MKICKTCGVSKPVNDFYKAPLYKNKIYYCGECKTCVVERNRRNPKKDVNYLRYRNKKESRYGIGVATISRYGLELSLFVYDRAKRKCESCGSENDLTIHHKDGQGTLCDKPNNKTNNLIVLCRSCHGRIHGKQGKGVPKRNGAYHLQASSLFT